MSKKIIVSVPDYYNLDNVVVRIKRGLSDDTKVSVIPVEHLTDIVPEIVEAILKTKHKELDANR